MNAKTTKLSASEMEVQDQRRKMIKELIQDMEQRLIEREQLIRIVLLTIFSKNHLFLIGERGVGKSHGLMLAGSVIDGAKPLWQLQVSEHTQIEEIYGAKYEREDGTIGLRTENSLLSAHFGLLDEMFKAKGTRLSGMLELLADGCYTSGDGVRYDAPLISLFGASNEYPEEKFMEPYVDRFLFWYKVSRIEKKENRLKYYMGDFIQDFINKKYFKLEDIDDIYSISLNSIKIPDKILKKYVKITDQFITSSVKTSDRKYLKILNVMKIMAYLNGRAEVDYSDLFILLHSAWHNDTEREKVERHLYNTVFDTKENINTGILKIRTGFNDQNTIQKGKLFDLLHYKEEFNSYSSIEKEQLFNFYRVEIQTVFNNYNYLNDRLNDLESKKLNIEYILHLVENNIFILNIKPDVFDEKVYRDISNLREGILKEINTIKQWLDINPNYFEYDKNRRENVKNAG